MSDYNKPLPRRDELNGEFYERLKAHELCFQRCSECKKWRHMPRVWTRWGEALMAAD